MTEKIYAVYNSDGEIISIVRSSNGKFYNYYSCGTAGAFTTFKEAEETVYKHRPKAIKGGIYHE